MNHIPVNITFYKCDQDLEDYFVRLCKLSKDNSYCSSELNRRIDSLIEYLINTGREPLFYCEFNSKMYFTYSVVGRKQILSKIKLQVQRACAKYIELRDKQLDICVHLYEAGQLCNAELVDFTDDSA